MDITSLRNQVPLEGAPETRISGELAVGARNARATAFLFYMITEAVHRLPRSCRSFTSTRLCGAVVLICRHRPLPAVSRYTLLPPKTCTQTRSSQHIKHPDVHWARLLSPSPPAPFISLFSRLHRPRDPSRFPLRLAILPPHNHRIPPRRCCRRRR